MTPTFAATLLAARTELHLTQAELGAALGYSMQTISNWETGRTEPWRADKAEILLKLMALQTPKPGRRRVLDRLSWPLPVS